MSLRKKEANRGEEEVIGMGVLGVLMRLVKEAVKGFERKPMREEKRFNFSRGERFSLIRLSNAHNLLQDLGYPRQLLDSYQRSQLKEMAQLELIPDIDVTEVSPKRIREFIGFYNAYKDLEDKEKIANNVLKNNLGILLKFLIEYDKYIDENVIQGDDYEINFMQLNEREKRLLVEQLVKGVISGDELKQTNTVHLKEYLEKLY